MMIIWVLNALDIMIKYWLALPALLALITLAFVLRIGFFRAMSVQKLLDELRGKDWRYDG